LKGFEPLGQKAGNHSRKNVPHSAFIIPPYLPADWEGFEMHYRYRETAYHIAVLQTPGVDGEMSVSVDGVEQPDKTISLVDDHEEHLVEVN
jgi:cellobiose phosphorylase